MQVVYCIRNWTVLKQFQLLIMILRYLKRGLGELHYVSMLRRSTFQFSKDDKQGKGFNNFKRRRSNKDPETDKDSNKKEETKNENILKKDSDAKDNNQSSKVNESSRQSTNFNIEGFSKFKRSTNVAPEMKKQNDVKQTNVNTQQKLNIGNQNNAKKQTPKKEETSINNKNDQKVSQATDFKNFKRVKTHQQVNQKKNQSNLKAKNIQKKTETESNDVEKKKQEALGKEIDEMFSKFKRTSSNKNKQPQKQSSINLNNTQKEDLNKEKNLEPKMEKINNTINNMEKNQPNENKAAQPSDKSVEDEQQMKLKQKEEFFKSKIELFKKKKQAEEEKAKQSNAILEFGQRIRQKILASTGIDINARIEPPSWVKNNPVLFPFFKLFSNMKILLLVSLGFIAFTFLQKYEQYIEKITPDQVNRMVDSGEIFRIVFQENDYDTETEMGKKNYVEAFVTTRKNEEYKCVSNTEFENMIKMKVGMLNAINPQFPILVQNTKRQSKNTIGTLRTLMSMVMLYLFVSSLMQAGRGGKKAKGKGGSMNIFEQSKSKRFQQKVNVKFNDVVGMQKSKQEIVEFIDFLMHPDKYHKLGAKIPRGALLTGPPGTGKTMIAKACAGESNVPFFTISGSQFIEMYVGVGAQRVRDLFQEAKEAAPSIIFIDEIDAVGKKRSAGFGGGNDERDNTLNQLLVEMDGFQTNTNVIVFAATNQKQVLDPALIRPGRFDRLIEVDLPDIEGRKQIFMVHLKPIVIDTESSMEQYARRMATLTPGFSGADIKNLCNEAAIMAARNGNKFVTILDFELATERVIAGVEKKSHLITPQTRRTVAYHECGHGVVSWFLEGASPLLKLTIIPRSKGSLGFAQYLPHETQISTKKQLEDQISVILAGRISEQVFFGKVSTGAYDDLQKAYNIAKMIVTEYGMNEKLGWLKYEQSEYAKYYSKQTQKKIDQEIISILKKCGDRTRTIIKQKRDLIDRLANKLLQVETLDLTTISQILGKRPFETNKQYEEYLKEHTKITEQKKQKDGGNQQGQGGQEGGQGGQGGGHGLNKQMKKVLNRNESDAEIAKNTKPEQSNWQSMSGPGKRSDYLV